MNLQETFRTRRKSLDLSQQDLSEMSGISLATIKDIERGKANPSIATISKIMDVLGMEIAYRVRHTNIEE
ncbi:MAG: helix-turn-helix transcriptional regulator [Bacteroidales bacterium]|nr:helix-turn-helix transcriptional regulator [Candidatus Egerieousia equi]